MLYRRGPLAYLTPVRSLIALALVCFACGCGDRSDRARAPESPSRPLSRGPDPIVLRAPRDGGVVRAYLYPKLDSVIWTSGERAAPIARVMAFDQEAGSIAFVDRSGLPGRLDLRKSTATAATRTKLTSLASSDGWAIYGIDPKGVIVRLTPSGNWSYTPRRAARAALPQADGSLLLVTSERGVTRVLRMRPPDEMVTDSVTLPGVREVSATQVGDRVYFRVDSGLFGIRVGDLTPVPSLDFDGPVRAVAPTPSGDRIFVAVGGESRLAVVDRFHEKVASRIALPGEASALRIDPLGRYLLARAMSGDSAWVIAIGTDRVVGSVRTAWRADLPLVLPDGALLLADGHDAVLVDGETLRTRSRIADGANDVWHVVLWNGFRPRSAELDQPVRFPDDDSARAARASADSAAAANDTTQGQPRRDSAVATVPVPVTPPPPPPERHTGFTVQFASVLSEARARETANAITIDGQHPRVVVSVTAGATVYRVILGPYPTRADAERVGRAAKHAYWVYEGVP